MSDKNKETESPLAARMRPRTPEEIVGQEEIIAPGKLLYRAIKADKISSLILYGPPGTGKTTIAKVIAGATRSRFISINATTAGKKDMEDAVNEAKSILGMNSQKTMMTTVRTIVATTSPALKEGPLYERPSNVVNDEAKMFATLFPNRIVEMESS